jgi:hypothetical protein
VREKGLLPPVSESLGAMEIQEHLVSRATSDHGAS